MYFRNVTLALFNLYIFMFIMGCASTNNLGNIPTSTQDFNLSESDMRNKYPAIDLYDEENNGLGNYLGRCTSIDEIIVPWGEPDEIKYDWCYHATALGAVALGSIASGGIYGGVVGTGIVFGIQPYPLQIYIWNKDKYKIATGVDTVIYCGYKKRLVFWKWIELEDYEASNQLLDVNEDHRCWLGL